ncbi:hypothetical protein RJ641_009398 [Dillenia turbinata]|uniref:Uncharacterized protein n=1 Tax=Dillenia turbinata TaxID=194707 RepID=A0AAN8V996_9MAGN
MDDEFHDIRPTWFNDCISNLTKNAIPRGSRCFFMKTLKKVPERWVCKECSLQQNNSHQPSENGRMQHQFKWQKAVGTRKVKFISPEEAAPQISGSWKSSPTISVSTPRRPLVSSDHAAPSMFSSPKEESRGTGVKFSGHLNPSVPGTKKPCPILEQQPQTVKYLKREPSCSAQIKKEASEDSAVVDRKGELSKSSSERARGGMHDMNLLSQRITRLLAYQGTAFF